MGIGGYSAVALAAVTAIVCPGRAHAEPTGDVVEGGDDDGMRVSAGLRAGASINSDQALLGGHALAEDGLGLEALVLVGLGGNHLTMRPSLRTSYTLWIGDEGGFGIMPAAGLTMLFYVPVGPFATWCNRVGLGQCHGWQFGYEVGGGVRYSFVRIDAMAGIGELPALTITVAADATIG